MGFIALDSPPSETALLYWADFVEFRALIHPDRCYSRGDLDSLLNRSDKLTEKSAYETTTQWKDIISFCQVRQHDFGKAYPFNISEDGDTLELHHQKCREETRYLELLLASSIRHIALSERNKVARFFEEVSLAVLSCLMPNGSEIHPSWANPQRASRYAGTLPEKMTKIAKDIRCSANFKPEDFKSRDSGDGGIDIVSWHSMLDEREGIPIAFAQCSCSRRDWVFKQLEAHPVKHIRHLPVMHPWATYYFSPFDMRRPDGDWENKSDWNGAIVVDRLRLLRLSSHYRVLDQWACLPLLTEAINTQSL